MSYRTNLGNNYSPLYFLAALGSGGLVVSFFMYLMFMLPHPNTPIPAFDDVVVGLTQAAMPMRVMTGLALAGVLVFAYFHVRLLIWNIGEYLRFTRTEGYAQLRSGNNEVQLMAIPLTYAMSVNVGFILGSLFVPGLWQVVEYLFPLALLAFLAIAAYGLKIFLEFFSRVLVNGDFDCARNNNLGQMLTLFAFAMFGVGFAAPAAMSHQMTTVTISFMLSVFFVSAVVLFSMIKLVLGFRAMMEYGVVQETTATLWIVIPILTVVGIALFRLTMALEHNFGAPADPAGMFVMLTSIFSLQVLMGLLGWMVMKKAGYFERYVAGPDKSVGSYALVCPGVALFVFANFLIHKGLIPVGLFDKFSIAYFLLYLPLLYLQVKTILLLFRLNGKLLRQETPDLGRPLAAGGD